MKKRMKKIVALALCLVMIFTLVACGTQESKTNCKEGTYTASATGKNGDVNGHT